MHDLQFIELAVSSSNGWL